LCRGGEDLGTGWEPSIPLSSVEREILKREMDLRLYNVKYENFERNIKRFGYTGRLTDTTLTEIKDSIHLEVDDLKDRNAITHFYYQDDHTFDHGNYATRHLLCMGFLLCAHKDT
jgi:hypothetical protein